MPSLACPLEPNNQQTRVVITNNHFIISRYCSCYTQHILTMFDPIPGIHIQPRDIALLRDLFESRLMTRTHAAALHFDDKSEACKKRIQRLIAAGLIGERVQGVGKSSILFFTWKAVSFLREGGHFTGFPHLTRGQLRKRQYISPLTLAHELQIMDVKAAFAKALHAAPSLAIQQFTTWPKLSEFNSSHPATHRTVTIRPDAFLHVREALAERPPRDDRFFLEIDRSSESLDTLVNKLLCYHDYYRSGGFASRFGLPRSEYKRTPFRVLLICKSRERLQNIATSLLSCMVPIRTLVWLATFQDATHHPLGTVWLRPVDCKTIRASETVADSNANRSDDHASTTSQLDASTSATTKRPFQQ
jgi:hypothetical protein